jgi:hypothetical protein
MFMQLIPAAEALAAHVTGETLQAGIVGGPMLLQSPGIRTAPGAVGTLEASAGAAGGSCTQCSSIRRRL